MPRRPRAAKPAHNDPLANDRQAAALRIIGGNFRGRKLIYSGDPRTKPMKDRVRVAVFNLVGPAVAGMHAVDLFAGTGALGLEALSRGALRATLVEQHYPTAAVIRQNIDLLGAADRCEVVTANTLIWYRRHPDLGSTPWLVFCSPPFEFYVTRTEAMVDLVQSLAGRAPRGSAFVVEADKRFDFGRLPGPESWDVRDYPPARVGIFRKQED